MKPATEAIQVQETLPISVNGLEMEAVIEYRNGEFILSVWKNGKLNPPLELAEVNILLPAWQILIERFAWTAKHDKAKCWRCGQEWPLEKMAEDVIPLTGQKDFICSDCLIDE